MNIKIRHEEYAALGEFIKTSFVRDQAAITKRFPKLNAEFLTLFTEKLEAIKVLESKEVMNAEQKNTTASLYHEAGILNKELNFLNSYISAAGLNTNLVSDLKNDLNKGNMEGAVLKIEAVKQFITSHSAILEEEGMSPDFPTTLDTHKTSLTEKNVAQNKIMNDKKSATDTNLTAYSEFYSLVTKIAEAGKLVFDDTITENEYTISKIIGRMRAPKHNTENTVNNG